jgi:SNF2 family DNA or RNA helicase
MTSVIYLDLPPKFTQILDILETILTLKGVGYLILTGTTPVEERQSLVDEFTTNEDIPVFLLSTRAGKLSLNTLERKHAAKRLSRWNGY